MLVAVQLVVQLIGCVAKRAPLLYQLKLLWLRVWRSGMCVFMLLTAARSRVFASAGARDVILFF